ncbi:MAG TPA: HAD-IIA family hydrolase [Solirubrobacterales bacterium]|nr:HAD-IIA family hydrolase [Solirubrobacterales bacterium]
MPLADRFDGLLIDLDGVVWIGREPVPGSVEALQALLAAGKRIVFVTNNPGRLPQAYAERLRELGVEVGPEQIVTAGMAVARLAGEAAAAAGEGGSAFVIGAGPLKEMVAATGARLLEGEEAEAADVVVVSGHRGFDYGELKTAKFALDRGARLFATSHDPTMPYPGGELPGTGAVLAAIEVASGKGATIAGKPERHLFEMAIETIRGSFCTDDVQKEPGDGRLAMIGDRISSDIDGGRAAGLETVLVLSGTTTREQAEAADPGPDHVLDDLAALLK